MKKDKKDEDKKQKIDAKKDGRASGVIHVSQAEDLMKKVLQRKVEMHNRDKA